MRRRKFITVVGGAAVSWPLAARAQQGDRVRRVGVLMNRSENDRLGPVSVAAFQQGLQQLGWSERNVHIEVRWGANDIDLATFQVRVASKARKICLFR
jgi:hypothetical protein